MLRTKMRKLLFVVVVVGATVGFGASPSHAATTGVINFTGSAAVAAPGLGYPVLVAPRTLAFSFSSSTCADSSGGTSCTIAVTSANGSVTGNCGDSTGSARGTITGVPGGPYNFSVTWTSPPNVPPSVAGSLVVTGTAHNGAGTVAGQVTALPTTGSCADGSATGFTIAGNVAYSV